MGDVSNERIWSGSSPEQIARDLEPLLDFQERGLSIEELDERKKQVAERLVRKFVESSTGCGRRVHPLGVWSALSDCPRC